MAFFAVLAIGTVAGCGDGKVALPPDEPNHRAGESLVLLCPASNEATAALPDLIGQEMRAAAQRLCDMGIRVGALHGELGDTVYMQEPAAGTIVPAGTAVNLKAR